MTRRPGLLLAFGFWLSTCGAALAGETAVTFTSVGASDQIPATLIVPEGTGPFPAIVIAHDCSGLGPRSSGAPGRWASLLVAEGYVVLIPDSFTPRGLPNGICTEKPERLRSASGYVRAGDAYAALDYLRTLPVVDRKHIGIMGGSHGGFTTLASMYVPIDPNNRLRAAKQDGFAAAIALYPSCTGPYGGWSTKRAEGNRGPVVAYAGAYQPIAPLLILIGEKDDWTPAEVCVRLAESARAQGYPVDIKVYPGAQHAFDSTAPVRFVEARNNANAPTGKGATTGGDPAAWADAKIQVSAFFARYLKR